MQEEHRAESEEEGVRWNEPARRQGGQTGPQDHRQRGPEGGRGGNPEGEGAGERIVEDRLHLGPGEGERRTDENCGQRLGQAQAPQDDALGPARTIEPEQSPEGLLGAETRRTDGDVEDEGDEKDTGQCGNQKATPMEHRAIASRAIDGVFCSVPVDGPAHARTAEAPASMISSSLMPRRQWEKAITRDAGRPISVRR